MPVASIDALEREEALRWICSALSPVQSSRSADTSERNWEAIVELASAHLVTPALALRPSFAPDELKEYFVSIHEMNGRRNAVHSQTLSEIINGLDGIGIHAVLLKGAAALVDGLYQDHAERIMGDLDLIVPREKIAAAAAYLSANGYREYKPDDEHHDRRWFSPSKPRHLSMLIHPESGVGVEIHCDLFYPEFAALLPASTLIARAEAVEWKGLTTFVPCATDRIIHNIGHDQLHHGRARTGSFELRQLRELALIALRDADNVDWREIEQRFQGLGHGDVLRRHAAHCFDLMGVRLYIDQSTLQPQKPASTTSDKLKQLSNTYFRRFTRDPQLALNLLNPLWWPGRVRGIISFWITGKL